jgi:hypothetical protein
MARLVALLAVVALGAVILAPIIMALDPDPLPGDFVLAWNGQHYPVPLLWSLCASGALGLLYLLYKR